METAEKTSPVTIKISPAAADIFSYKMYHSFVSASGVLRILFSLSFIVLGLATLGRVSATLSVLVIGIGILNPVISPLMFLSQSKKAAAASTAITYTFSEEKIVASDGKKRADINWNELALVVWRKSQLLLYTLPQQALVLPRKQMSGKDGELLQIIKAAANPSRTVYRKQ